MTSVNFSDLGMSFVTTVLYTYFSNNTLYLVLFAISLIFLLVSKRRKDFIYFPLSLLFLVLTIFNPFVVNILFKFFNFNLEYYRFFWLVPVTMIIAVVLTNLLLKASRFWQSGILLVLGLLFVFAGNPLMNESTFRNPPENLEKVPDELIQIIDSIKADSVLDSPTVIFSADYNLLARQYDASIILPIERNRMLYYNGSKSVGQYENDPYYLLQKGLMDVVYRGDASSPANFEAALQQTGTNYIVFSANLDFGDYFTRSHCVLFSRSEHYLIYRYNPDVELPDGLLPNENWYDDGLDSTYEDPAPSASYDDNSYDGTTNYNPVTTSEPTPEATASPTPEPEVVPSALPDTPITTPVPEVSAPASIPESGE